ncbi:MAG TPA: hypothetical protein VF942_09970, partial [Acidimicrobiales bacterium]
MSRIAIVGGQLVTPSGVETGTVVLRDGTIERVIPGTTVDGVVDVVDASGLYVSPGFIDLQCNGAHGIDLTAEPERLWDLARVLPEYGVTAFLPTIVSSPPAVVERDLAALHARPRGFCGSEPLGL